MSIVVYNEVETPIVPIEGIAGRVREALGGALRSMRYVTPDFAGLYQDAAGTTPVTAVGQPVGLMLDRRFRLARGPELVSDPDLSDPGEWASTAPSVVLSGGVVTFTESASGATIYTADHNTLIADGKWYEIEVVVDSLSSGSLRGTAGRGADISFPSSPLSVGRNVLYGRATGTGGQAGVVAVYAVGTTTAVVSRISARELPGNHASQTTTTARPTLRSGPLRIDYDGVDDYLRTVFPALGSDVTIARSIPGVGAQILTGQTIAAGDWDDNVTSCATLVIDRDLTGPETALVTAFLNQQAGV